MTLYYLEAPMQISSGQVWQYQTGMAWYNWVVAHIGEIWRDVTK